MSFLTQIPTDALTELGLNAHQAIMAMFDKDLPGDPAERRRATNILFEVTPATTLVSSDVPPAFPPRFVPSKSVPELNWDEGHLIRFHIAVNGVHRLRGGGTAPVADIESWIAAKLRPALNDISVIGHERTTTHTGRSALQIDTIDGLAVVGDIVELRRLTREGVGRAKAYGCGLLLVAG